MSKKSRNFRSNSPFFLLRCRSVPFGWRLTDWYQTATAAHTLQHF